MRPVFFILPLLVFLIVECFGIATAQSSSFEMKGSGAAVLDANNPTIYSSIMKVSLSGSSTMGAGGIIVRGDNMSIVARFVPDKWVFSYLGDGSFHGEGIATTNHNEVYSVSVDGKRIYATSGGSMWRVSAVMQGSVGKLILSYLLIGNDPIPAISISNTEHVIIPNGNSAQANTGFFVPLDLEIMRGTTVIWENQDNIGHTVQSQDAKGNVIPLFNSPILKTGDTFEYKFDKPGVYHYFCTIHPWRIGVVTVS